MTEDELDDILGRGPGDPDMHGYPGEKPAYVKYIGEDKAVVERSYEELGRRVGYPWNSDFIDYDPRIDESWDEWEE